MGHFNVYLGFGRTCGEAWQGLGDLVLGSHSSAALVVDTEDCVHGCSMFTVTVNGGRYEEIRLQSMAPHSIRDLRLNHDFLHITSSQEEHDLVLRTCRACVQAKLGYNYDDVCLMNVPFRSPVEKGLFEVRTLHDSQAAILILRECLGADHLVQPVLRGAHSRTTMCWQLFRELALVCPPFAAAGIAVREDVRSRGRGH
jgi:hypothetical protein